MTEPEWRPALLGEELDRSRVRCGLCPFRCVLRAGEVGICKVRRNVSGTLQTATFATSVAHLDAIERKPFYHVLPGARVLTLAAPGCTFRCDYCINYRISQYGRDDSAPWTASPAQPGDLVAQAVRQQAMVGLSYTEPGLAPELTLALAEHAIPAGVPLIWKTNGFLTRAAIDLVAPALTAVNIDVKSADDAAHRRLTGAPLRPVFDAIERFRGHGVWVEVSTPLIPGICAEQAELRTIADRLRAIDCGMPWHLLRFTPDYRMTMAVPTLPAALRTALEIGRDCGLGFVYVERALGQIGRNTLCPACGQTLVVRGTWNTVHNSITGGRCPECGLAVPGLWDLACGSSRGGIRN
jgi:pyruvate formate lyase activating enzyme